MKREFNFNNCTVVVHLPKTQDTVRKATEYFLKKVEKENEKKKD